MSKLYVQPYGEYSSILVSAPKLLVRLCTLGAPSFRVPNLAALRSKRKVRRVAASL
jgi:hypothetical protein